MGDHCRMMLRTYANLARPIRSSWVANSRSLSTAAPQSVTDAELEELAPPGWRVSKMWRKPKSVTTKHDMHVIFLQDTPSGKKGEVLWVNKGLARNFYFPRHEAVFATSTNLKKYQRRIGRLLIVIKRHEKPDGSPHAPCFRETIMNYLWRNHSIDLQESQILLEEPIAKWGEYLVPVDLGLGEVLKLDLVFQSFKTKTKKAKKQPAADKE